MVNSYYEKLDESEKSRIEEVHKNSKDTKLVFFKDIFRNKSIIKAVTEKDKAYIHSFDSEIIPSAILFYKTVFVEICPGCKCVWEPELIKPYLEKKIIIPILQNPYSSYNNNFSDIILQYPHISMYEFDTFRTLRLYDEVKKGICPSCASESLNKCYELIEQNLDMFPKDKPVNYYQKYFTHIMAPALKPFLYPDYLLINEIENSINEHNFVKYDQLSETCSLIHHLRSSQAFKTIPQIKFNEVNTINDLLNSTYSNIKYDVTEIENAISNGLKLVYNSKLPLDIYLDIITKNRSKINKITKNIIEGSDPNKDTYYSDIITKIEEINSEIIEIQQSKRHELLNIITNFLKNNTTLLTGCFIGAALGLTGHGLEFLGLGAGSGIIAQNLLKNKINITDDLKPQISRLLLNLTPGYERLLAYYLSKELEVIQIWIVQKQFRTT